MIAGGSDDRRKARTCGYELEDHRCDRTLHDEESCIFHSEDIEGKKGKFLLAFFAEFDRQKEQDSLYNFMGFVFPEGRYFHRIVVEKHASFLKAIFIGGQDFNHCKFEGNISFNGAEFKGHANFRGVFFCRGANFHDSKFFENATFQNATFSSRANFTEVKIQRGADFHGTEFLKGVSLRGAEFGKLKNGEDGDMDSRVSFSEAQFLGKCDIYNMKFNKTPSVLMRNTYYESTTGLFETLKTHQKILKRSKRQEILPDEIEPIIGPGTEAMYPIESRIAKDDMYILHTQRRHPGWGNIWWLLADYGRSFKKWAGWSLG